MEISLLLSLLMWARESCRIAIASRLSGPLTYNTAAEYSVKVEPAPIHMVQPAYRSGTVLAYDRYLLRGFANADGARIDVERNGKTTTVLKRTGQAYLRHG